MAFRLEMLPFAGRRSQASLNFLVRGFQGGAVLFAGLSGLWFAHLFWGLVVPEAVLTPDHLLQASHTSHVDTDEISLSGPANPFLPLHRGARPSRKPEKIPVTRLQLTLHGVRTGEAGGIAIISEYNGVQRLYAPGDTIDGTSVGLLEIAPGHVIISRSGKREKLVIKGISTDSLSVASRTPLRISDSPAPRRRDLDRSSSRRVVLRRIDMPRSEFVEAVSKLWLEQTGLGPIGGTESFSPRNPLFSRLGLRRGDVIVSIGGIGMEDSHRFPEALAYLNRREVPLELELIRKGKPLRLKFEFSKG